jgi:hypothetical protein
MGPLEICLIVIGLIFIVCSFLFSEHILSGEAREDVINGVHVASVTEEIVRREVEAEVANVIDEKLDEMEVKLEKMTTEKLMSMGDFSNDIQAKIEHNHEEVMFLYNMLNDKEEVLKNTIRDIEAVKMSVKKMAIVNDVAKDITTTNKKVEEAPKSQEKSSDVEKQPEAIANSETKKTTEKERPVRNREMSNNNQMILNLYAQGKTNIEIAKELGLGIGEVRLVIDLFNSR